MPWPGAFPARLVPAATAWLSQRWVIVNSAISLSRVTRGKLILPGWSGYYPGQTSELEAGYGNVKAH
jgi:hypothetical protein